LNGVDPIKNPYLTAYFAKPNFNHFKKTQLDLISKIRSGAGIEHFQGFQEPEREIPIEYIHSKLEKIIQSRTKEQSKPTPSFIMDGIDQFQEMVRRLFLQSYIHKNTVKTKRISKE